jgi:hypothetical protein
MAIASLVQLMQEMKPALAKGKFYFATVDESRLMDLAGYLDYIHAILREKEGLAIIFEEGILREMNSISQKPPIGPFAKITLNVQSDLLAVGFLAKITGALAKEGISANAISAYHHDHIFVPYEKRAKALETLRKASAVW